MDRRAFVGITAAGVLSACASLVVTPVRPEGGRVRLAIRDYPTLDRPGGWLKLRPEGSQQLLYVLALDDGEYAAVSATCKHLGCTVGIEPSQLVCPCHGSTYARDGSLVRGPAQEPLDRFPVFVSGDGVLTIDLQGE